MDDVGVQLERLGPLQEGDVIVMRFASRISQEHEAFLHARFEEIRRDRGLKSLTVIVLEAGQDISLLKPEVMKQLGYVRG